MTTHIKAFTYKPKIPKVLNGDIRQTIRIGSNVEEGDQILFHSWTDRPYRSKWGWRLRILADYVKDIRAFSDGLGSITRFGPVFMPWDKLDYLAVKDGIISTDGQGIGETLGQLINSIHKDLKHSDLPGCVGRAGQIIRWPWPPVEIIVPCPRCQTQLQKLPEKYDGWYCQNCNVGVDILTGANP